MAGEQVRMLRKPLLPKELRRAVRDPLERVRSEGALITGNHGTPMLQPAGLGVQILNRKIEMGKNRSYILIILPLSWYETSLRHRTVFPRLHPGNSGFGGLHGVPENFRNKQSERAIMPSGISLEPCNS